MIRTSKRLFENSQKVYKAIGLNAVADDIINSYIYKNCVLVPEHSLITNQDTQICFELAIDEELCDLNGEMQAGALFTALDFWTTVVTISNDRDLRNGVSVDINVDYMAPLAQGEEYVIISEALKNGKTLSYSTCRGYDKEGEMVFQGQQTIAMVKQGFFEGRNAEFLKNAEGD